jgi:ADP-ribose pyrophosphatase YjhB (NUDIX family)
MTFTDWTGASIDAAPTRIQVGTSAYVLNAQGQLLLQRREDNGHWAMPGGRLDLGEDLQTCAVREVFEECGLHVRITRLVGMYSDPRKFMIAQYKDGVVQMVNVCFACEIIGGALAISDESTDIGFFDLDALPGPLLLTHIVRIADARRNSAPVIG